MEIFWRDPLTGAKIAIFDRYMALASITDEPTVQVIALMRHPSSAINKRRRTTHQHILFMTAIIDDYPEENTT